MADCSKALSDVLDYNHTKDARLTALHSVQSKLDSHEQLDDVLDAVGSKWRKLTDCFLEETDFEILVNCPDFCHQLERLLLFMEGSRRMELISLFTYNGLHRFCVE